MAQRVVDQVGDQQLDELGIAGRRGGGEAGLDVDALVVGFVSAPGQDGLGYLGEVERLPDLDTAFAGGQRE